MGTETGPNSAGLRVLPCHTLSGPLSAGPVRGPPAPCPAPPPLRPPHCSWGFSGSSQSQDPEVPGEGPSEPQAVSIPPLAPLPALPLPSSDAHSVLTWGEVAGDLDVGDRACGTAWTLPRGASRAPGRPTPGGLAHAGSLAGPFPEGVPGSGPDQSKDRVRLGTSRPPRLPPCLSPFPDLPGHHLCAQDPRVSLPVPKNLM